MKIATNIFNSPETTGPGNFARRLSKELSACKVVFIPEHYHGAPTADIYFCSAFFDETRLRYAKHRKAPCILRVDGLGAGDDFERVKQAHHNADIVIYQSEYSRQLLQTTHGFKPLKSFVIHNGVSIPKLERLCKPYDNEFISICNTWNEVRYRNFIEIVYKMLPTIKNHISNFCWTIVGKYQLFKEAMPDADKLPIKFIDFRPDIDYLRQISKGCIHIVPTDSCPNSVIESMAMGVPCIVWHDSGGPELIGNGGIVLRGEDPFEVVRAIEQIVYNNEKYSAAARLHAEQHLDIKIVAAKYAEVFRGAIA